MMTVAQLAVEITANTRPAEEGMHRVNQEVERSGGLFTHLKGFAGDALSTLAGFLGSQILFAGLNLVVGKATELFGEMVTEAGNLSDAENILNARLASTHDAVGLSAEAINQLAESMSQMSGVTKSTILQGDNMLLTFTNIGKNTFPQASQAMLDLAISMNHGQAAGADLQTAAIELGKALNDPLKGMTALARVGVTFSDEQKKLIKDYMAHGEIAKAQAIILQELQREFGNTAKAAGNTLGGSIDKLKNLIVDFGANALGKLGEWLTPIIVAFTNNLPGALKVVGDMFSYVWDDVKILAEPFAGLNLNIGTLAKTVLDNVGPAFMQLHNWLYTATDDAGAIWQVFSGLADGLKSLFSGGGGGSGAGGLATQLQALGQTIQAQVLPMVQQLAAWFKSDMLPAIQSVLPTIKELAVTFVTQVVPAFVQIEGYVMKAATTIAGVLLPVFLKVEPIVVRLTGYILDLANKAIKFLLPYITQAAQAVTQFASDIATRLQPFIEHLTLGIQLAAQVISVVWSGLWPLLVGVAKPIIDVIVGFVKILWDMISNFFKIGADLLSGNWKQLWKDLQDGAKQMKDDIIGIAGKLWDDLKGLWKLGVDKVQSNWHDLWNGLAGIAKSAWDGVKGVIMDGINGAIDLLNHLVDAANVIPGVHLFHIPHVSFAAGGVMPYPGMAWVGEHGPEPVFLPQGSRVLSHEDTMRAVAGGGGQSTTINLHGPTSDQLMQQLTLYQQRQKALVLAAVR